MTEAFNTDCMEAMAQMEDNSFDLAIVDPPYGIGDVNQANSRKFHSKKIIWNDSTPNAEYFAELLRVSKNQIIWGINYYSKLVDSVGRIIHDKTGSAGKQLKELSDADIASHSFGVNIKIFHYEWRGNVQNGKINWKNLGQDARIHPTQKPIALYKWLLKNYAKEGDRILDTHLGSGSSRIACHDMGFDFVGYEIDKDYFDAQEKRFANHIKQGNLFEPNDMY